MADRQRTHGADVPQLSLLLSPKPLTTTVTEFAAAPVPSRNLLSSQLVGDAAVSTE